MTQLSPRRPAKAHQVTVTDGWRQSPGCWVSCCRYSPAAAGGLTTATLNWPQGGQLNNVTAPLISLTPVSVTATDPVRGHPVNAPKGGWCSAWPAEGQRRLAELTVRHGERRAGRRHRPQRRGGQRPRGPRCRHRAASGSRSPLGRGHLRHFIGAAGPSSRTGRGFATEGLRLPPQRREDRTSARPSSGCSTTGPAPAGLPVFQRPIHLGLPPGRLAPCCWPRPPSRVAALWRCDRWAAACTG